MTTSRPVETAAAQSQPQPPSETDTLRWSKDEIEQAVLDFVEDSTTTWVSGDIEAWANWYTDDAVFRDLGFGYDGEEELRGREAIFQYYRKVRDGFPGGQVQYYPCPWYMIDEERALVVLEWRCRMTDPGDGSIHEEPCYSRLTYGGNRQWSFEEDIYNPVRMGAMIERWLEVYSKYHPGALPTHSPVTA
ncbi:nuclear transport factor 2 family protein [Rhodococcus sp. NCIMB 12038]|uniref:nuclear transport factor 2 family protein n=1 Tax=Rhodococcus sp. NCIMB 12038 TaxID=933800 RepID=UPI000B3CDF0B|nr:nuclear transport factor 2 family protein [Rhodococcus sp. NCIMB 12038]OUS96275.1 hypothetical protein CA951_10325 [Rhodococcus sp. NCIMB 12038]